MKNFEKEQKKIEHELYKIFVRLGMLLVITIGSSLVYKGLIESGIFYIVRNGALFRLVFCMFEIFIIGVYWHYVFKFSRNCRHKSRSKEAYYRRTYAVCGLFSIVYLSAYAWLSRDAFLWVFRITVNLMGVRLDTTAPDSLLPYMLIYLAITFSIMLLEPKISKRRRMGWKRKE